MARRLRRELEQALTEEVEGRAGACEVCMTPQDIQDSMPGESVERFDRGLDSAIEATKASLVLA